MSAEPIHHRVLLVAADAARGPLRDLLPASGWEATEAASIEQACFVQKGQPCDVVVLDGALAGPGWGEALTWLSGQRAAPVVLVCEAARDVVLEGLDHGASWMPADVARQHPELFAGLLTQAVRVGQEWKRAGQTATQLRHSNARVDRLLGLLWEAAPGDGPSRLYSQRHMLERLDEEVARIERHGGLLSVVLGELRPREGKRLDAEQVERLRVFTASKIAEHKRRSDVAGQYGLGGFMLLLPQTSPEEAAGACGRLRTVLEDHGHDDLPAVHACFGTASVPGDLPSIPVLLRRAEERLNEKRER